MSAAHVSTPGIHLQNLVLDAVSTPEQKADCLKLLRVVIKNLADPVKAQDAKYRQLRLENAKVQQKLLPLPVAVEYLKALGFVEADEGGEHILRIENDVNVALMQTSLLEVTTAIDMVMPAGNKKMLKHSDSSCSFEEKKTDDDAAMIVQRSSSTVSNSSSSSVSSMGRLSEKQKARLLLEQNAKKEKEEAKAARKKSIAALKQDKFVRKNDPNWKAGVSAARAKTGDGISTFRDKYGEN